MKRVWKIAPGRGAENWDLFRERGCIGLGWLELPDFLAFESETDVLAALKKAYRKGVPGTSTGAARMIWQFGHEVRPNDLVIANKGYDRIVGIGRVTSQYLRPTSRINPLRPDSQTHRRHVRQVDWLITDEVKLPNKRFFVQATLDELTDADKISQLQETYANANPRLRPLLDRLFKDVETADPTTREMRLTWPMLFPEREHLMPMEKVGKKNAITKPEFHRRLRHWFTKTDEPTVGPGESQHVVVRDRAAYYRFDADTKRTAVGQYLSYVDRHGDSVLWTPVPSARGSRTKIAVGPDLVNVKSLYLYALERDPVTTDRWRIAPTDADDSPPPETPPADPRKVVEQQIRVRRGQRKFRNSLLNRYGSTCVVTGCRIVDILEAAHIRIVPGNDDNRPENGLLLRADIHTLFDLDLLGIDPGSLTVHLHDCLKSSEYAVYRGQPLRDPKGGPLLASQLRPSKDSLQTRFRSFKTSTRQGT